MLPISDTADPIRHRPGCPRPFLTRYIGNYGDEMTRCMNCKAFTASTPPESTEEPSTPLSRGRWRCRDHPDQPVNWKGKGCPRCEARARKRRGTEPPTEFDPWSAA